MTQELEIFEKGIAYKVKFDDCDSAIVAAFHWNLSSGKGSKRYVYRHLPRVAGNPRKSVFMHQDIFGKIPAGMMIDHKNGDGLDNRRSNLRLATRTQNNANSVVKTNNTSGFKGVRYNKRRSKWQANIRINNKDIYLGLFADPQDAAHAYDAAAIKHFGEFARTNMMIQTEVTR